MDSYVTRLRSRVILSEKPNDGTVAITYEDIDDSVFLAIEDCLPTLPNTVSSIILTSYFVPRDSLELISTVCSTLVG